MTDSAKADIDNSRKKLETRKAQLTARISDLASQDPFSDPERVNDNAASDREASEESDHDRVSAVVEELQRDLAAVDAALTRIADGTYGICVNCGNPIAADRLRILPSAAVCLSCESKSPS